MLDHTWQNNWGLLSPDLTVFAIWGRNGWHTITHRSTYGTKYCSIVDGLGRLRGFSTMPSTVLWLYTVYASTS